jgi:hypothetical protein
MPMSPEINKRIPAALLILRFFLAIFLPQWSVEKTRPNRGFVPWRFSYAGRQSLRHRPTRPASENLHKN